MKFFNFKPHDNDGYERQNENSSVIELRFQKTLKERLKDWLSIIGSMILSSLVVLIIPIFNQIHGNFLYEQKRNHSESVNEMDALDWRTDSQIESIIYI